MSFDKQNFAAFWRRFAQRFSTLNWITALWSVALFFIFPVVAVFKFTNLEPPVSYIVNTITAVAEDQIRLASIFSIIMAALTTNAFNYLNSKTQLDFYHSQPVSRKEMFFTNYFAGWVSFAAPLTTAVFLEAVIVCLFNGFLPDPLLKLLQGYVGCILAYFAINALFTLAVTLCGKRTTSLLTGAFLCFAPYTIVYMTVGYFFMMSETYTDDIYNLFERICSYFHPLNFLYKAFSHSNAWLDIIAPSPLSGDLWLQALWVVISVLVVLTSLWLYTRRKSEDAEKPFIYSKIIPFIRYPSIIFIAYQGGVIFDSIAEDYWWKLFGIAISGVLAFFVFSFVEKRGFRGAFRSWWRLLISAGTYIGCILLIFVCAMIFDTRTAKDEDIVAIDVNYMYYQEYYFRGDVYEYPSPTTQDKKMFTVTEPENIKTVNRLIKNCVKAMSENDIYLDSKLNDEEFSAGARLQMLVKIYTKNGSFERTYGIYCNSDGETEALINKFAYSLEATLTQEKRAFSDIDPAAEDFKFNSYSYQYNSKEYTFSAEEAKLLYDAIKKDFEEAVLTDYEEHPLNYIQIHYSFTDSNNETRNVTTNINIYKSYENALAVLGKEFKANPWIAWWRFVGKFDLNVEPNGNVSLASEKVGYEIGREIGKYYGKRDAESQSGYTEPETHKSGYNNYTDAFNEGLKKGYDEGFDKDVAFAAGYEEGYKYGTEVGENAVRYGGDDVPPEQKEANTNFRKGYNEGFVDGFKDIYYSKN